MRQQLLSYYKAIEQANGMRLNHNFIENIAVHMLERLAEGELAAYDIEVLKIPSNASSQQVIKNIFGITLTKTQYKNAEILKEYTGGKNTPVIDMHELIEQKKVAFIKSKLKEYVINNLRVEYFWTGDRHIVFSLETKEGSMDYAIQAADELLEKEYIWLIKYAKTSDDQVRVNTTVSDKYLSWMDFKLIKEELLEMDVYQTIDQELKLRNLFV